MSQSPPASGDQAQAGPAPSPHNRRPRTLKTFAPNAIVSIARAQGAIMRANASTSTASTPRRSVPRSHLSPLASQRPARGPRIRRAQSASRRPSPGLVQDQSENRRLGRLRDRRQGRRSGLAGRLHRKLQAGRGRPEARPDARPRCWRSPPWMTIVSTPVGRRARAGATGPQAGAPKTTSWDPIVPIPDTVPAPEHASLDPRRSGRVMALSRCERRQDLLHRPLQQGRR